MPAFTTIINNVYLILVPVGILIGSRSDDFAGFAMTFIFYLLFVPAISGVLNKIMYISESFMQIDGNVARMDEILNIPEMLETSHPTKPVGDDVAFHNVSFSYTGDVSEKALENVSFSAKQGQITAIVGPSGGGKTTLCNLIPRFYEVTGGRILIDGQDIQHVTLKSLREDIGIVQQDVYLFSGSVADNIAYGKPGATREEIIEAARLAGAERFISALKDGFDTYVGERGVKLSGGQKQRIAIARVFLKNPPILILDEATSALDNESEILVGQSLEKLAHGRTTLTIAHRLTTIKDYDRILVLGEEGIVEQGTHAQLLEKQGVYYRLWNQLPAEDGE